ncbi:MAG TPA: sugar ABC transporter permease [Rectinemataceae bacterium]|nr:sugar ABC transporter permease [Rectinemataceae bacterium]
MAKRRRILDALGLIVLLGLTVVFLYGGFAVLKDFAGPKLIATVLAIVWGLGSVALLYYVLNALAERLPRGARRFAVPVVFAGPALVLLFWFLVMPTLRTLWLSFFDETSMHFVGLKNYVFAFTDRIMLNAFRNNLMWVVFGTFACVSLGLIIAVLADRSRSEKLYKAIIFMPMAISFVGAGVIWMFMYSYRGIGSGIEQIGLLNAIVVAFGGQPQAWLLIPFWNNFLLIVIMVWLQTGFAMVILSSSIKAIPGELLEAARIDGATELQIFFKVIIPSIEGSLVTVTTTIVIFSLKLFDIVRVMTGGNYGTNVIANEFYMEQFTYGQTGRASSIAIVLLVAVVPIMIYNLRQFAERRAFK